jgi:hypothetical protein
MCVFPMAIIGPNRQASKGQLFLNLDAAQLFSGINAYLGSEHNFLRILWAIFVI